MKYSADPIRKVNLKEHIHVVVEVATNIMKKIVLIQEKGTNAQ